NNLQGPIVADPNSQCLYDVYTAGERQTKCCSGAFNNVYVARSTDGGSSWETHLVFHAPPLTDFVNIFPSLAVDQTTGQVYAVWSVYDSQLNSGTLTVSKVSNTPNRVGAVCTNGSACAGNVNRELLDLFQVAEDPLSNKAAIIYTSSEISTYTAPDSTVHKLP